MVEILIVLALVGVFVHQYITEFQPRSRVEVDAQRVLNFIERVRGLAVFENRTYSLVLKGKNSVSAWQRSQGGWIENRQMANILIAQIESVSHQQPHQLRDQNLLKPSIIVFSDGNISSFRWKIYIKGEEESVFLVADATGRLIVITP